MKFLFRCEKKNLIFVFLKTSVIYSSPSPVCISVSSIFLVKGIDRLTRITCNH